MTRTLTLLFALAASTILPLAARAENAPSQLIEHSHIIAPYTVGAYQWKESQFNAQKLSAGAGFTYQHSRHPELRISVFVYPAGLGADKATLEFGMQEFHAGLQQAQQLGITTRITEESAFDLPYSLVDGKENEKAGSNANDPFLAVLARWKIPGQRLLMEQTHNGMALHSAGYLFYRSLYFYKVRVSAPKDGMESATFNQLADDVARSLVPAITVINVGDCGKQNTIYLPKDGESEEIAISMSEQLLAMQGRNCSAKLEAQQLREKMRNADVIRIDFPANAWSEQ